MFFIIVNSFVKKQSLLTSRAEHTAVRSNTAIQSGAFDGRYGYTE